MTTLWSYPAVDNVFWTLGRYLIQLKGMNHIQGQELDSNQVQEGRFQLITV